MDTADTKWWVYLIVTVVAALSILAIIRFAIAFRHLCNLENPKPREPVISDGIAFPARLHEYTGSTGLDAHYNSTSTIIEMNELRRHQITHIDSITAEAPPPYEIAIYQPINFSSKKVDLSNGNGTSFESDISTFECPPSYFMAKKMGSGSIPAS